MVPKRHFTEGQGSGSEVPGRESRRRLGSATNVGDSSNELSVQEFVSRLEPIIRRVVREEMEQTILPFCDQSPRSSLTQTESSGARAWHLHFQSELPSTLFTGSRIESVHGEPVKIIISDANSKKKITTGPLSSIKINIVALDGDFGISEQEDWTEEDFNANIVHEREGKRPLITGDLVVTLRDGVGFIGDASFTDNSSWVRCRKFRLGARVQSISPGVRIREAKSEAFVVKDHRGESYKKHHPPSVGDEVWRLERIAKDGAFHRRLFSKGISTVKDFLQLHVTDPSALRNILGGGISNKTWGTIIKHATACILDGKFYYWAADGVGLVFNSIFQVVGAFFDGQNYQCVDNLNPFQMRFVEDLKRQAYKNLNDLVPIDEPSVASPPMLLSSLQASAFSSPSLGMQDVNIPVEHQDQLQMQLGSNQTTTSPPYSYEVENNNQLEVPIPQNSDPMQVFSPNLRSSFARDFCFEPYTGANSLAPSVFADGEDSPVETSMWQGNEFFLSPNNQTVDEVSSDFGSRFLRNGNPRARWCKIRAVVKWGISVRRDVAAKRMARLLSLDF